MISSVVRTVVASQTLVDLKIVELNDKLNALYPAAVGRSIILGISFFGAMSVLFSQFVVCVCVVCFFFEFLFLLFQPFFFVCV